MTECCQWKDSSLEPCLAVLMPVFNEEATLSQILEKVLAQPQVKEVVCVDDGSSDHSWEILETYTHRDQRVKALRHKQNLGKGSAIKTALEPV